MENRLGTVMYEKEVRIQDLCSVGLIEMPLTLFGSYRGVELQAVLEGHDKVCFCEQVHSTLSGAGTAAKCKVHQMEGTDQWTKANGWNFWSFDDKGQRSTLGDKRKLFAYISRECVEHAKIAELNVLMLKLKYDVITDRELDLFYEQSEGLFWDMIWKSNCLAPKEDIFQEMWMDFLGKKHTWDETRRLKCTTWFWYAMRSCLGVVGHTDAARDIPVADCVEDDTREFFVESNLSPKGEEYMETSERYGRLQTFIAGLEGLDESIVQLVIDPTPELLERCNRNRKKKRDRLYKCDLARILEVDIGEIETHLRSLQKRFHEIVDEEEREVCSGLLHWEL